jgi:hypothetical protein
LIGAAVLLIIAGVASAGAQSMKVRQMLTDQEELLKEHVDRTNKECESSISVKFDWKGVLEDKVMTYSASGYCDGALSAIRATCEMAAGKDAVKQKIKTMTCGFGGERSVTLKEGALDYKITFEANDKDYVYKYLQNNL